jgi:hypothetical protein
LGFPCAFVEPASFPRWGAYTAFIAPYGGNFSKKVKTEAFFTLGINSGGGVLQNAKSGFLFAQIKKIDFWHHHR